MRKQRFGPSKTKLVAKIRRTSTQAYGNRFEWYIIIKKIKDRDGNRCRKCGSTQHLQVDHIIPVSKGGRSIPSNLWTLCDICHSKRPGHKQAKNLILSKRNKK